MRDVRLAPLTGVTAVAAGALLVAGAWFALVGSVGCACEAPPEFDATYDPGMERLTVVHRGGDPFDAGELYVTVGDDRRSWAAWGQGPANGTVATGDTLTVEGVDPGHAVRVSAEWGGERRMFLDATARELAGEPSLGRPRR